MSRILRFGVVLKGSLGFGGRGGKIWMLKVGGMNDSGVERVYRGREREAF